MILLLLLCPRLLLAIHLETLRHTVGGALHHVGCCWIDVLFISFDFAKSSADEVAANYIFLGLVLLLAAFDVFKVDVLGRKVVAPYTFLVSNICFFQYENEVLEIDLRVEELVASL